MSLDAADEQFKREIAGEAAGNLGRAGRKVEAALAALQEAHPDERPALLKAAADAVYNFLVQRELNGLTNEEETIRLYAIPREVLKRVGIVAEVRPK